MYVFIVLRNNFMDCLFFFNVLFIHFLTLIKKEFKVFKSLKVNNFVPIYGDIHHGFSNIGK